MKINLKFWEYFGSKTDLEEGTQLVPSRKPKVRLNIKGVQLSKRKNPVSDIFKEDNSFKGNKNFSHLPDPKLNSDFGTHNINSTKNENITNHNNDHYTELVISDRPQNNSKESLSSRKTKRGFTMPDFPFFSKKTNHQNIKNNKAKLDEGFLKNEVNKPTPWGLVFLGFSILVLIATSIYVFWNSGLNAGSEALNDCKTIISDGVVKGLKTNDLDCNDKKFGSNLEDRTSEIKKTLQNRETEIKAEIDELDKTIKELQNNLTIFDIAPEIKVISQKNYQSVITAKKEQITDLNKKLEEKKLTIDQFQNNYEYLLGVSNNIPLDSEKKFLDDYKKMNDSEKFKNFGLFKENFAALQEKLKFQVSQSNPYAAQGFSDPDFFKYKILDAAAFVSLFDEAKFFNSSNTSQSEFVATGDKPGDKRILDIAKKRGYKLRPVANPDSLSKVDNYPIDSKVVEDFQKLQDAAKAEGIQISVVSAFRSPQEQKELFVSRLQAQVQADTGARLVNSDLGSGKLDGSIDKVLTQSSIPGYSKHHTGFTIDINQNDSSELTTFGATEAYKWISANNYFNAKKFGFIPSYPEGSKNVGPEPEPWEYVWVGKDNLLN